MRGQGLPSTFAIFSIRRRGLDASAKCSGRRTRQRQGLHVSHQIGPMLARSGEFRRTCAVGGLVPRCSYEQARHAAEAGHPCSDKPGADDGGNGVEPRRDEKAEEDAEEREAAGADLNLPL